MALLRVSVPVTTLWTSPDAPRPVDAAAIADQADPASSRWVTPQEALALGLPAPVRRLLETAPP